MTCPYACMYTLGGTQCGRSACPLPGPALVLRYVTSPCVAGPRWMVLPLDHASLFQWWYNAYDQRSFQIAQLCFQEAEVKCLPAYALNSTKRVGCDTTQKVTCWIVMWSSSTNFTFFASCLRLIRWNQSIRCCFEGDSGEMNQATLLKREGTFYEIKKSNLLLPTVEFTRVTTAQCKRDEITRERDSWKKGLRKHSSGASMGWTTPIEMFWASSWTWSCPCLSAVHYLFGAPFAINVLLPYLKTVSVSIAFAPDLSCRSAMRLVLQGLDMKRLPGAGGHSTCAKERKKLAN
jgi:hypothetical protein